MVVLVAIGTKRAANKGQAYAHATEATHSRTNTCQNSTQTGPARRGALSFYCVKIKGNGEARFVLNHLKMRRNGLYKIEAIIAGNGRVGSCVIKTGRSKSLIHVSQCGIQIIV